MRFNSVLFMGSIFFLFFISCQGKRKEKTPDISQVHLSLPIEHFERDFFAMSAKGDLSTNLKALKKKYGAFYTDFLYSIAAFSPRQDDDPVASAVSFIQKYKSVADSIPIYYPKLERHLAQIEAGLKRAKVYFPKALIPQRIITYVGPFDSYGAFYADKYLAIGLQQFLGPDYKAYQSDYLINLYGSQKIHTFSENYIPATALRTWLDGTFPQKTGHLRLIDLMVEEGRKIYALKRLLPQTDDKILLGYSLQQFQWCENTQSSLMHYFSKDNLFETQQPEQIIQYTSDQFIGPGLPDKFPSNIGKFIGWKLVSKYMDNHKNCSLQDLFQLNLQEIALGK